MSDCKQTYCFRYCCDTSCDMGFDMSKEIAPVSVVSVFGGYRMKNKQVLLLLYCFYDPVPYSVLCGLCECTFYAVDPVLERFWHVRELYSLSVSHAWRALMFLPVDDVCDYHFALVVLCALDSHSEYLSTRVVEYSLRYEFGVVQEYRVPVCRVRHSGVVKSCFHLSVSKNVLI